MAGISMPSRSPGNVNFHIVKFLYSPTLDSSALLKLRFALAEGLKSKNTAIGVSMKLRRSASRAGVSPFSRLALVLNAACSMALAGCTLDGAPSLSAAQPRGATVAFESIEGPPPAQFRTLVQNLNDEAQSRRLAVISRETPSAYRVRGYLAAKVVKGKTTIAWVWDVFDGDERRALRISGEETAKGPIRDAWTAADDAMLRRIAHSSMDQLAVFLTSSEVAPNGSSAAVATADPQIMPVGLRDPSPEAAGIFRIFRANADPVSVAAEEMPAATDKNAATVPVPRRKPAPGAAVSARDTFTLAASE